MKKISFFVATFFTCQCICAQQLDTINVRVKDTLRNAGDCVINIKMSRKDGGSFQFPENFRIGDETRYADLLISIEKLGPDKQNNYMCRHTIAMPAYQSVALKYKKYKVLKVIDSLHDIFCIERGEYRLKVIYNLRPQSGTLDDPDYRTVSNWAHFYVDANKIYTNQALIDYMERGHH